jgi:hypothetical protein
MYNRAIFVFSSSTGDASMKVRVFLVVNKAEMGKVTLESNGDIPLHDESL